MNSKDIHLQIEDLVEREHALREESSPENASERAAQLKDLEVQLDRCWDLLRQRRARIHAGENPAEAHVRSAAEVEGYRQ
ncbi:DUF2630 family protein [Psychromicrobium xiongbiense]|uniref:DUF2630 family protein n=1 Tax=Psychromicrobium xiongbiense TaxID=3051184 RepID=UPI002556885F|nr:DUF2630 family protein [Psychromicrobium sp. YIM S02556]